MPARPLSANPRVQSGLIGVRYLFRWSLRAIAVNLCHLWTIIKKPAGYRQWAPASVSRRRSAAAVAAAENIHEKVRIANTSPKNRVCPPHPPV